MSKMGSTSLYDFFVCSGIKANHWSTARQGESGLCMLRANQQGQPMLSSCDSWSMDVWRSWLRGIRWGDRGAEAFLQMDYSGKYGNCIFPQVQLLDQIHWEAPNATFILNFRPINDWARSVKTWSPLDLGTLGSRLLKCDLPMLPVGKGNSTEDLLVWWCWHVKRIRSFVAQYPSHALVELDLYDDRNAEIMAGLFDSRPSCWGNSNTNASLS